ncbi:MAG: MoaD/ThiS family protein [Candidatus Thermoplasmatota archaeon]
MRVTIRFTGRYKNLTGLESMVMEIKNGDTVWHLIEALVEKHPALVKDKKHMIIIRNGNYIDRETKIKNNDEITIIPPVVSGG